MKEELTMIKEFNNKDTISQILKESLRTRVTKTKYNVDIRTDQRHPACYKSLKEKFLHFDAHRNISENFFFVLSNEEREHHPRRSDAKAHGLLPFRAYFEIRGSNFCLHCNGMFSCNLANPIWKLYLHSW